MQAARLLLPGVDCPVRPLGEETMRVRKVTGIEEDALEATRQIKVELAFRLMASGRAELIQQALLLLPANTRLDMLNHQGHTALMLAAINNDDLALLVRLKKNWNSVKQSVIKFILLLYRPSWMLDHHLMLKLHRLPLWIIRQ